MKAPQTIPAMTRNQALVFDVLEKADGPLSAYTILDRLRDQGFRAPLQVYRALEKLLEYGVVHRLESINSFVACAHPGENCHSHGIVAFAICESCGQVMEFHDHEVDRRLMGWVRDRKFKPEKTTIEIRGLCETCAV